MATAFLSFGLALFDSLATTQQIIIFTLLLTTEKPLRNSLAFLGGLVGAYWLCGFLGILSFDALMNWIKQYLPTTDQLSNQSYYAMELLSGGIMVVIGLWYYRQKRHAPTSRSQNLLIARLKSMKAPFAFGLGVVISVTSFPMALPYLAALGKYTALQLSLPAALVQITIYNLGYAFPMLIILAIYLFVHRQVDDLSDALHEKARVLNVQLTTWAFAGVGLLTLIDAGCYFVLGQSLFKGRLF